MASQHGLVMPEPSSPLSTPPHKRGGLAVQTQVPTSPSSWSNANRLSTGTRQVRTPKPHTPLATGVWPPVAVASDRNVPSFVACLPEGTRPQDVVSVRLVSVGLVNPADPTGEVNPDAIGTVFTCESIAARPGVGGSSRDGIAFTLPEKAAATASASNMRMRVVAEVEQRDASGEKTYQRADVEAGYIVLVSAAAVRRITLTPRVLLARRPASLFLGNSFAMSEFPDAEGDEAKVGDKDDAAMAATVQLLHRLHASVAPWQSEASAAVGGSEANQAARAANQIVLRLQHESEAEVVEAPLRTDGGLSIKPLETAGVFKPTLVVGREAVALAETVHCCNTNTLVTSALTPGTVFLSASQIEAGASEPTTHAVSLVLSAEATKAMQYVGEDVRLRVVRRGQGLRPETVARTNLKLVDAGTMRVRGNCCTPAPVSRVPRAAADACRWEGSLTLPAGTSGSLSVFMSLDSTDRQWLELRSHIAIIPSSLVEALVPSALVGPPSGGTRVRVAFDTLSDTVLAAASVAVRFVPVGGGEPVDAPSASLASSRAPRSESVMDIGTPVRSSMMSRAEMHSDQQSVSSYSHPTDFGDDGASLTSMTALDSPSAHGARNAHLDVRTPPLVAGQHTIELRIGHEGAPWVGLRTAFTVYDDKACALANSVEPTRESRYGGSLIVLRLARPFPVEDVSPSVRVLAGDEELEVQASFSAVAKRTEVENSFQDRRNRLVAEAAAIGLGTSECGSAHTRDHSP